MNPTNDSDASRRAYWSEQLNAASAMLDRCMDYPVQDCLEPLVSLRKAVDDAGVEVLFSTSPIAGDLPRIFFLRKGLIGDFLAVAQEMNRRGWVLRVEDGFRTREMQKAVARRKLVFDTVLKRVIWELEGKVPSPEFMLRRLTAMVVTIPKLGTHMSGSAIDISVTDRKTGADLDRGGPYLEISELTPMDSPFISAEARKNRGDITAVFRSRGFVPYPYEFWHYNKDDAYDELLADSGKPARYGAVDWNPADGSVIPIPNPKDSLHSIEEIRAEIARALKEIAS